MAARLFQTVCILYIVAAYEPTPANDLPAEVDAAQQRFQHAEPRMLSHEVGGAPHDQGEGHAASLAPLSHGHGDGISPKQGHGEHAITTTGNNTPNHVHDNTTSEHGSLDYCPTEHGAKCTQRMRADIIKRLMPSLFFAGAIITFQIGSMFLLIVTKWKDADVRRSVFQLISTTVSIFIAIFVNKTIFDVWALQILPCPGLPTGWNMRDPHHHATPSEVCGRAPPDKMIVVCFLLYFLYLAATQALIFFSRPRAMGCLRGWNKTGFVASILGAHLQGFAAVGAFGLLQFEKTPNIVGRALLVVLCAAIFFITVHLVSSNVCCSKSRRRVQDEDETARENERKAVNGLYVSVRETDSESEELQEKRDLQEADAQEDREWIELISESEDDSASLCLGFLFVQALCLGAVGFIPPVEDEEFHIITTSERNIFLFWEAGLILLFGCIGLIRFACHSCLHRDFGSFDHVLRMCQSVVGMTLSWLSFRHGDWLFRQILNDVFNPQVPDEHRPTPPQAVHLMARVVNAIFFSAISIILVILFDLFADIWEQHAVCAACESFLSALNPGFSCCFRPLPVSDTFEALERKMENSEEQEFDGEQHNPFREVIPMLGFLVGVCWEKAFSEANSMFTSNWFQLTHHVDRIEFEKHHRTLGPFMYFSHRHPIWTKVLSAILIVTIVFLTWVKYLVPYARLGEAEHTYLYYTEGFVCEKMNARVTKEEADKRYHKGKYHLMLKLLDLQANFAGLRCRRCQDKLTPEVNCEECSEIQDIVERIMVKSGTNQVDDSF